ncbi:deoxyribose-phosphate aldolase [Oligoflexaceae bacterium]|nr:deoxyribose-phosphate aldolase [Oligoflexaceae bacterium]
MTKNIAKYFDHTILSPNATESDVRKIAEQAMEYNFYGVCVNGCWLQDVSKWLGRTETKTVAVLGFPLGAMSTESKVAEARYLVDSGAQELDMVINIGKYLGGQKSFVEDDIAAVREVAGQVPLKVIVETSFLDAEQIKDLTRVCVAAEVAFIKTSTGFASRGASEDDVRLMKEVINQHANCEMKIKASGGIRSLHDFEKMVAAGADRIGASASVGILQEHEQQRG